MDIRDVGTFEIIQAAWNALPRSGSGGRVYVLVDTKTGEVYPVFVSQGTSDIFEEHEEVLLLLCAGSQSEIISDWVLDEDIIDWEEIYSGRTRYDLPEDELHSCTLDVLHEWFEKEIQKNIQEIIAKNPHLA